MVSALGIVGGTAYHVLGFHDPVVSVYCSTILVSSFVIWCLPDAVWFEIQGIAKSTTGV